MPILEKTTKETIDFIKQIFPEKTVKKIIEEDPFIAIIQEQNIDYVLIDYQTPSAKSIVELITHRERLYKQFCKTNIEYLN